MSKYIRKTDGVARELAPQLSILARITDLFIDMDDRHHKPSKAQFALLAKLTDEAMRQAAVGKIQLVSALPPYAKSQSQWYGRDETLFPLPALTPRTYRVNGCRVS